MTTIYNKEAIQFGEVVQLETIICCECAIPFAVPVSYKAHLRSSQERFFCPSGHGQSYSRSTETILREKLEKERQEKEAEVQRLKAQIFDKQKEAENWQKQWSNQLSEKKKAERKLKRLSNGVCHCCNRTFSDLQRHMKSKHPEELKKSFK